MAKKATFEIYEGLSKRKKTFTVIPFKYTTEQFEAAVNYLKRANHCSARHIFLTGGYILDGLLYFGESKNKKAKRVYIFHYIRDTLL